MKPRLLDRFFGLRGPFAGRKRELMLRSALVHIEEVASDGHPPNDDDWQPWANGHDPTQAWCADRAQRALSEVPYP